MRLKNESLSYECNDFNKNVYFLKRDNSSFGIKFSLGNDRVLFTSPVSMVLCFLPVPATGHNLAKTCLGTLLMM